jgi:tyrosine-protein phosphatase YwqE
MMDETTRGVKYKLICDAHNHLLHNMDSGACTLNTSLTMARALYAQGVRAAILCPTYDPRKEPIQRFLLRREEALSELKSSFDLGEKRILLIPSAEVSLTEEIAHDPRLTKLLIPATPYLPCTLPLTHFTDDTVRQIAYLIQKREMIPFFLHFERYLSFYTEAEKERLIAMKKPVFCLTVRALIDARMRNTSLKMLVSGKQVIPITNAHNLSSMPPEIRPEMMSMDGTHAERVYHLMCKCSDTLFRPLMHQWRKRPVF